MRRGLSFMGMLCTVPCLALLAPWLGTVMVPGQPLFPAAAPPAARTYQFPRQRHELSGFHYQLTLVRGESLSCQGSRLTLQNKKMGFLRFALLQEVLVADGIVTIRLPARANGQSDSSGPQPRQVMPSLDGLLAPFPGARALALVCQPVRVTIDQGEEKRRATITADSARVEADDQTIHFAGAVTLAVGATVLTTAGLDVVPQDATLRAGAYTVSTPQGRRHGQALRSDIFLAALGPDAPLAKQHP